VRVDFDPRPTSPYRPGGEPAWLTAAGRWYAASPYAIPALLGWASGSSLVLLWTLAFTAVFVPAPPFLLARWAVRMSLKKSGPAARPGFRR
jgi:hypothetical protein